MKIRPIPSQLGHAAFVPHHATRFNYKERSEYSEQVAAAKFGGKTQIASGALRHAKGDIITDRYLIEDKVTDANSYSLKKAIWEKIRLEAFNRQRTPMMRITINGRTLCVVEENEMLQLTQK